MTRTPAKTDVVDTEPHWERVRRLAAEGQGAVTVAVIEAGRRDLERVRTDAVRMAFVGGLIGGAVAVAVLLAFAGLIAAVLA